MRLLGIGLFVILGLDEVASFAYLFIHSILDLMDFKSLTDPVILVSNAKSSGFFKKKQILAGIVTVFLLFAVGLGVFISQKPTQLFPQADDDRAELLIQPQTLAAVLNQEITSDLFINTNGKIISDVNMVVKYDDVKLQLLDIKPGTFMDEVDSITPTSQAVGSVTIKLKKKEIKGAKGSGILASLKFKVLDSSSSESTVSFDETLTTVKVKDSEGKNNIKTFGSQALTLNPAPSPTPSSSAGASPSPDASASASPSPVASGSNAASPTPGGSASASPSPASSQAPSPSPSATSQKGDGNNDGRVDLVDLSMLYSRWSPAIDITSGFNLDFNDDKRINSFDLAEMTTLLTSLGVI